MNIWLVMVVSGVLTFAMRFSFIYVFGRFEVPLTVQRALRFVPPAVLSAIVLPQLLMPSGSLELGLGNRRLLAGVIAILTAAWTKNTLLTILVGMIALLILQFLL